MFFLQFQAALGIAIRPDSTTPLGFRIRSNAAETGADVAHKRLEGALHTICQLSDFGSMTQDYMEQLKAMLLRHGHRYTGKSSWTAAHERYLAEVRFEHPAQNIAYAEYRCAVREAHDRTERITAALRDQVASWRWQAVVPALMALRGVEFVAAVTLIAELGDLARFAHPKQLMSYLGLVPSEYSTGESRVQGKITKTGNGHVRRILIESAWAYRLPAGMSRSLVVRNEAQPKIVRDIAWRAQLRLCSRFRHLQARGVHHNKTCTAIARELAGFIWDIARQMPAAP